MRHIIIGVDSGKTAAIACLSLDGKNIGLATHRFGGVEWFISTIKEFGSPVIVAYDKQRPNSTVSKLATVFNAVLFTPDTDIDVRKKKELIADRPFSNLHERDALASALVAYGAYSNKLNQTERLAKGKSQSEIDDIKAMVIRRYSISEAIQKKKSGRRF